MYTPIPMKRSTRYGNNSWEAFSIKMNRDVRFFSDLNTIIGFSLKLIRTLLPSVNNPSEYKSNGKEN
ncbi:hypothetical protein [Candidatus Pristimantibacillus sp. PTI5]|uniref:hypothetical protein n=1 Tax=Candidatus Pristimantibacillus sp. PTI5 TaxID=3400422 RepID=UPI003B017895